MEQSGGKNNNDVMNTSISSKITTDTNLTAASRKRAKKMWDVKTNLETVDEIKEKLKKQHNPD
jgi:Na+/phosphate symporter